MLLLGRVTINLLENDFLRGTPSTAPFNRCFLPFYGCFASFTRCFTA
jgi:hypothetical protein